MPHSVVKSILFAELSVNMLTLSIICGFIGALYVYIKRLQKSYRFRSAKSFEKLLHSFNPEPLIINHHRELLVQQNVITDKIGKTIKVNNRELLNLASDNYLNLIGNEKIEEISIAAIRKYGVGSCGPRGFYGTVDVHLELEERIAKFMNMEEAAVYSYGFSTIASTIPAYCKRGDVIFCDEKISFAAQKGIEASKCKVYYFKHNDVQDFESKIETYNKKHRTTEANVKKFLLLEGLYMSTGNICNLPEMVKLRSKYKMRLFLDESLSIGVLGKTGRGIIEHFHVDPTEVDMVIGSLEGLIGSVGGFCVGTHYIIEHHRLSGLGYCFSASLPPLLARAAICAFDYMDEHSPEIFESLRSKCIHMHRMLETIPNIHLESNEYSPVKYFSFDKMRCNTDLFVKKCLEKGIAVNGTSDHHIKITVNIILTNDDIKQTVSTISTVLTEC